MLYKRTEGDAQQFSRIEALWYWDSIILCCLVIAAAILIVADRAVDV